MRREPQTDEVEEGTSECKTEKHALRNPAAICRRIFFFAARKRKRKQNRKGKRKENRKENPNRKQEAEAEPEPRRRRPERDGRNAHGGARGTQG